MKILVITACTARKKHEPPNQLQPKDCATSALRNLKSRPLREEYETPAEEMYTGDGHKHVMNGVKNLRNSIEQGIVVDVHIISPAYGLLNENDPIVPYNYDFKDYPNWKIEQRSKKLKIHAKVEYLLSSYDLAFFLLSEPYLTACPPPFNVQRPPPVQIFLVADGALGRIPNKPYIHAVCVGEWLDDQLEGTANNYKRKEIVFERLCTVACDRGLEVFEEVKQNPKRMIEIALDCNRGR